MLLRPKVGAGAPSKTLSPAEKQIDKLFETGEGGAIEKPGELTLPSVPLTSVEQMGYNILLYGHWGIGKSSFAASFPDTFHLFYEPSGRDLVGAETAGYRREPKKWEDFVAYVALLEKQKASGTLKFKWCVIDVIDGAYADCMAYVCAKLRIAYPRENNFGKDWKAISDEFVTQIKKLMEVTPCIFVSHSTEKDMEQPDGSKPKVYAPTLATAGAKYLFKVCDIAAFYQVNRFNGKRELVIDPNPHAEVKCRFINHFNYKDGSRMPAIPMGNSMQEAFKNYTLAFENKFVKPETKKTGA